jgi:hypothetical protein
MIPKHEKHYLSISELAKHWNFEESKVCELIWQGQLVPSWYFNKYDSYRTLELEWDDEINDLWGSQAYDATDISDVSERVEGYFYLVLPKRTSPKTCEFFTFSEKRGPFLIGDWVSNIPTPISLFDVKQYGVVLNIEIEKYEKENNIEFVTDEEIADSTTPISRFFAQETAILKTIEELELDPKKLPRNLPGKSGVKALVRQKLKHNRMFTGPNVFKKAWERLAKNGDIIIIDN